MSLSVKGNGGFDCGEAAEDEPFGGSDAGQSAAWRYRLTYL